MGQRAVACARSQGKNKEADQWESEMRASLAAQPANCERLLEEVGTADDLAAGDGTGGSSTSALPTVPKPSTSRTSASMQKGFFNRKKTTKETASANASAAPASVAVLRQTDDVRQPAAYASSMTTHTEVQQLSALQRKELDEQQEQLEQQQRRFAALE